MAASKMINRRRFITRDVHLDIPEDGELRLTDDVSEDDETLAQDENSSNRTWPRLRTWRPGGSTFASHFGLQQVSSSSRLSHHQQPTLGQDWGHDGWEEGASFQRSGNEWRYRSHSAATATAASSSPCLSNLSPISTSRPEIRLESQRHDDASFDDVTLFGDIDYRDVTTTSVSGRDAKRRSRSLNDSSSSHLPATATHPRSPSHQNPPRPGSVLHRALAWESAGKLQPRSPPSRSPRPSNAGFADNFEDISTHRVKKTDLIPGCFPVGSVAESDSVSGKFPDHSGFFRLRLPPSSVADPVQNAPSGKCLSRHSFDMGRPGIKRTANGNSHGVERGGSARVSPVCHFPTWKTAQDRELFPGSGTLVTDPFDPRNRKSSAETIDNNNGSGFRKPFRSKSFKLLTFDPAAETSYDAVNGNWSPGQRSMTSPEFASINSTAGRFKAENESFLQPKLHLSMLSLNSENRHHHQNNEGLNPRAMSSSNLTAQSTGISTGNSTGISTGNSTGISTGNSVTDSRHGFSRVLGLVPVSPLCGENRGEFSNSLSVHKAKDSPTALSRPVGSNLVVKRLTNLTKNPFAPNSKLEETNAPLELLSRTGQRSKAVIPAINKRDDLVFVNPESIRSDSRTIPFTRLVSGGKVEWMGNVEDKILEKSPFSCGISSIETSDVILKSGEGVHGVFQKNPKFKSAKEMYLENPAAAPEPENAGTPRRNPDPGPPTTASGGRRSDVTSGTGRPNGDAAPTRLIRVFLKSSTQLKDEAGRSGIGRVQIGSVETGSDLTGRQPTHAQLRENMDTDMDFSTTKALDSIINDVNNMELEATKYRESAPKNQQVVSLGWVEPRQSLTNNQGHFGGNFVGKYTGQTVHQNVAVPPAEDPICRSPATVGSNRCFLEIADAVSVSKRPFEIVKKRLIIPDSMASFRTKEDPKPEDEKMTRRGSGLDVPRYGNFGKDGKVTVTSPPPTDFAENSSKNKTTTDSSTTSRSVPSTLDRKRSGRQVPAPAATVKCSDLETALRKIEADMGIIAKAGAKVPPGIIINKAKPPDAPHTTITTTNTCKGNRKDSSGVVSLFTCTNDYNEIRLQTSGISTGGGAPPPPPPPPPDYHPGLRPSSSASSSSSFVTTELDRAIEMLTLGKQQVSSSPSSQVEQRTGGSDVRLPPSSPQSRKELASPSPSPSPARHSPASRITVHLEKRDGKEGKKMTEMSAAYLERYTSPVSAQSSCASVEPIRPVRLDPLLVVAVDPETGNRHRIRGSVVREDSFDRPDSPPVRKPLPLPKDSVIMRHRMHQKELRCCHRHHRSRVAPGTAGSLSLSLSSSSDGSDEAEDGSMMRPAPKRTAKSKGVAVVKEEEEEELEESTFSSTTSIRPLSVDDSLLSEENL